MSVATDPGGQATAFARLLADRVAVTHGKRIRPDATPGGPLRLLDEVFGSDRVDLVMVAAVHGRTADHLQPAEMGRSEAFAARPATRAATGGSLPTPAGRPLLRVWRGVDAQQVRRALAGCRQLPGPFAAAADALLLPVEADLRPVPVTLRGRSLRLVCGPLERLAEAHLQAAFERVWAALKARARGGRAKQHTRALLQEVAQLIRPGLMAAKHDAELRGDAAAIARFVALTQATDTAIEPSNPTNPARWYSTDLAGRLEHWAALGCVVAHVEPACAGWLIDVVPLPPVLHPPDETMTTASGTSHRRMADWWRARRDASRLPTLFPAGDTATDPYEVRTCTVTRYRPDPDGKPGAVIDSEVDGVSLNDVLTDPEWRTVLLAPPGSGKSDSLRVAAHHAADRILRSPSNRPARTVIVATAAAAATAPGATLLEVAIAAADPSTPVDLRDDLLAACRVPDAGPVVLVDGYDELADPSARARVLDLVDAAAHPVVLASRPDHHDVLRRRFPESTHVQLHPLDASAVRRLVTGWLQHRPDLIATAQTLLDRQSRLAELCTRPLYARLVAVALAGDVNPESLTTRAELLHEVLRVRVLDPARHKRPLPLTREEVDDRIDAAAAIGLAHLEARSITVGTLAMPVDRVSRRHLREPLKTTPLPEKVVEEVLGGLGLVEYDSSGAVVWPHHLLGEYLAGRALADLACSADHASVRRHAATVLLRRAWQPDWRQPLALCAGELDRRARTGDTRAATAMVRHRALLTEPVLSPHSTAADINRAVAVATGEHLSGGYELDEYLHMYLHEQLLSAATLAAAEIAAPDERDTLLMLEMDMGAVAQPDLPDKGRGVVLVTDPDACEFMLANTAHAQHVVPSMVGVFGDLEAAWHDLVAAAKESPQLALAEAFASKIADAADTLAAGRIERCTSGSGHLCSCWPEVSTAIHPAAGPRTGSLVQALTDELRTATGPRRQRIVHGLLSAMAHGCTAAASSLLHTDETAAAETAVRLASSDVPSHLHVDLGIGPTPLGTPPVSDGDPSLGIDLPPITSATQFRAAAALLGGHLPGEVDDVGDLFHLAASRLRSGLAPDQLLRWTDVLLTLPPPTLADGSPDWVADAELYEPFLDNLLDRLDPPADWLPTAAVARHRLFCPAMLMWTRQSRRWPLLSRGDGDAACDAVGHDDDDRWMAWRDHPTSQTIRRGLEAIRRQADNLTADDVCEEVATLLGPSAWRLDDALALATDASVVADMATLVCVDQIFASDDPSGLLVDVLMQLTDQLMQRADDLDGLFTTIGGLLLRSDRWPEALMLTRDQQAFVELVRP